MKALINASQALGRALMLPIAVLPLAGLLLRLGQPDLLGMAAIAAAGDAIFSNLGILFAIGVAVGLAKENHGAAGLAGVVGYLVATKGAEVILAVPPSVSAGVDADHVNLVVAAWKAKELGKLSVPIGIISGALGGLMYNRYANIRLPSYLAFFGGRRFVPIVTGGAGLLLAFAFGHGWPVLEAGMDQVSQSVVSSGGAGLFAYGVLNRLLIVTGLHHIINNLAWFLIGDYGGVTGDLKRFFAGDPSAGFFMSGFFPVMMFGLPAACFAMYRCARPERRRETGGLLLSMSLTSFLTGVTEPIEFTFMFLAPLLYLLHAVLTGVAMVLMYLIDCRLGFGFSAGLFDYILNFKFAQHPLYLLPVGALYFALYYGIFRWAIVRFDLKTPGREPEESAQAGTGSATVVAGGGVAPGFIAALGGSGNLLNVDACTTRLRLRLADPALVDEAALRKLGSRGVLKLGEQSVQVVLGPIADQVASEIREALHDPGIAAALAPQAARTASASASLAEALGGAANIESLELGGGRLLLKLRDVGAISAQSLQALGVRAVATLDAGRVHLLHAQAESLLARA
jgi:PTS system N-acetylglucosamine-specific IIC component